MRRTNHNMGHRRSPHDLLALHKAREDGRLTYVSDRPCPKNHEPTLRYVKSGRCTVCNRDQAGASKRRAYSRRNVGGPVFEPLKLIAGPWNPDWGQFEDDRRASKKESRWREWRRDAA